MSQNGVRAKEPEVGIAEHVFSLSVNQHLKIYHFTLFQKPAVIEILRKRMVVINIEYG